MNKTVLIVDDEEAIVEFIELNLKRHGFKVLKAYKGEDAINCVRERKPDIILLDIMLPDIDGFQVCRSIREISQVPVIMLTARGEDVDKILGLEIGADDYMAKPFNPRVLVARIKAILRRLVSVKQENNPASVISFADIRLDLINRTLFKGSQPIELTPREFDLLKLLITNEGKLLKRQKIVDEIWKQEYIDFRSVDVHIRRLREKIEEDPTNPRNILTVWGKGYKFST